MAISDLKKLAVVFPKIFLPLYLWILFLIGLAFLVTSPPFSGFDEPAHYSSIRQIADSGKIPVYGKSFIDPEALKLQNPYLHQNQAQLNYEAQHPPLYYMALAPLEKMAEALPVENRLMLLRIASLLIALSGVAFGFLASGKLSESAYANSPAIGFMLYPLAFSGFVPEFARVGNDSLCIFFVGLTAFLLSLSLQNENSKKLALAIGITLGAGLLTKAFFIPILVGLGGFLLVRAMLGKKKPDHRTDLTRYRNILLIVMPALFIGGGWYVYKFLAYGDFIGGNDTIELAEAGGFLSGLKLHFTFQGFWEGSWIFLRSYLFFRPDWLNTTLPPIMICMPTIVILLLSLAGFIMQLSRRPAQDHLWLPVWLYCAMGIGFLHHIFVGIALGWHGLTPGWYLHILMPWIAPALGMGICTLLQISSVKPFVLGALIVGGVLIPFISLVENFLTLAPVYPFLWIIGIGGIVIGSLFVIREWRNQLAIG